MLLLRRNVAADGTVRSTASLVWPGWRSTTVRSISVTDAGRSVLGASVRVAVARAEYSGGGAAGGGGSQLRGSGSIAGGGTPPSCGPSCAQARRAAQDHSVSARQRHFCIARTRD